MHSLAPVVVFSGNEPRERTTCYDHAINHDIGNATIFDELSHRFEISKIDVECAEMDKQTIKTRPFQQLNLQSNFCNGEIIGNLYRQRLLTPVS